MVRGDISMLADILGAEHHFGDMDMRVTGMGSGVGAWQLYIKKADSPSIQTFSNVFEHGGDARAGNIVSMR